MTDDGGGKRKDGQQREEARCAEEQWLEANREALTSSKDYVERHGLPLARYRQF